MSAVLELDINGYLPEYQLGYMDRMSMANSLEVRVPILDHEFVEWVAGIPPELKLQGREGKVCFKKSLESHLPPEILYRDKMGFGVPIGGWFHKELKEVVRSKLLDGDLLNSGIFERKMVGALIKDHQSGKREHSAILWALLMFEGSLQQISGPTCGN